MAPPNPMKKYLLSRAWMRDGISCVFTGCNKAPRSEDLVFCDNCNRTYHLSCLEIPLADYVKLEPPFHCKECADDINNEAATAFRATGINIRDVESRREDFLDGELVNLMDYSAISPIQDRSQVETRDQSEYYNALEEMEKRYKEQLEQQETRLRELTNRFLDSEAANREKEAELQAFRIQQQFNLADNATSVGNSGENVQVPENVQSNAQNSANQDSSSTPRARPRFRLSELPPLPSLDDIIKEEAQRRSLSFSANRFHGEQPPLSGTNVNENSTTASSDPSSCYEQYVASEEFKRLPIEKQLKIRSAQAQVEASNAAKLEITRKSFGPIPKFSGKPIEWMEFYRVYQLYRDEGQYPETVLKNHVRTALVGTAKATTEGLWSCETTAEQIVESLRIAYGSPHSIMASRAQNLESTKFSSRLFKEDATILIAEIQQYFDAARTLNMPVMNSNHLAAGLLSKLNDSIRLKYNNYSQRLHKKSYIVVNLETLLLYLQEQQPLLIEKASNRSDNAASNSASGGHTRVKGQSHNTYSSSETKVDKYDMKTIDDDPIGGYYFEKLKEKDKKCEFCAGNHYSVMCDSFLSRNLESRLEAVKSKKLCHCCIIAPDHWAKECQLKNLCGFKLGKDVRCTGKHHSLLHKPFQGTNSGSRGKRRGGTRRNTNQGREKLSAAQKDAKPNYNCNKVTTDNGTTIKVFRNKFFGPLKVKHGLSIGDSASEVTLLNDALRQELGIEGTPCKLDLAYSDGTTRTFDAQIVTLVIKGYQKGARKLTLEKCYALKELDFPRKTLDMYELRKKFPYLNDVSFAGYKDAIPDLLIGSVHASIIESKGPVISGGIGTPVAIETELGLTVYGGCINKDEEVVPVPRRVYLLGLNADKPYQFLNNENLISINLSNETLSELLVHLNSLENVGVKLVTAPGLTRLEQQAVKQVEEELKFRDDGYVEVPFPWKLIDGKLPKIPNNYPLAFKRQQALEKQFVKFPDRKTAYDQNFKALLDKGYCRELTKEEKEQPWPNVNYLPMGLVVNENKQPAKYRNVFDASASYHGTSLNDHFLKGPDILIPLLRGIFNIRQGAVAFTADVKDMYHRIKLVERDQQVQRILYRADPKEEMKEYVLERLAFGPKPAPFLAMHVKNKQAERWMQRRPDAAKAIIDDMYMDDMMGSAETVEAAYEIVSGSIEIFDEIKWELVGVQSNSRPLLKLLPSANVKQDLIPLLSSEAEDCVTKILGFFYNPKTDCFVYQFQQNVFAELVLSYDYHPTRREQVGTLARIFDFVGWISHYLIQGRIIAQRSCLLKVKWEEKIPNEYLEAWKKWVRGLNQLSLLKIPRQYGVMTHLKHVKGLQIHGFADAGNEAYSAVIYFAYESDGKRFSSLVVAKARVTPINERTKNLISQMPRLELLSAVMLARLFNTTITQHPHLSFEKYLWIDSRIVLRQIQNEELKLNRFALPRIDEILDLTERNYWRHVPSELNVADLATKPQKNFDYSNSSSTWFKGPAFLCRPQSEWPNQENNGNSEATENQLSVLLHQLQDENDFVTLYPLPTINDSFIDHYKPSILASWPKLVRAVARSLRLVDGLQKKIQKVTKQLSDSVNSDDQKANEVIDVNLGISAYEFARAEEFVFRKIQHDTLTAELTCLEKNQYVKNKFIQQLNPFLDSQGIMRINSRVKLNKHQYPQQYAPILPRKHPLVQALILYYHDRNYHIGTENTLADLRAKVWIMEIREALKSVISKCNTCKVRNAKPVAPMMAPLPLERIDPAAEPFETTGLDCFGPITCYINNRPKKIWVLIFTCARSRFIHLHILESLSTLHVKEAIVTFWAAFGPVRTFISDRGTNFIGARADLKKEYEKTSERWNAIALTAHDGVADDLTRQFHKQLAQNYQVEWKVLPPYSPWMGGFYERLIKDVKRALAETLESRKLTKIELNIALKEAEHRLNCRPLTHIPVDPQDNVILTPHHLAKYRAGWPLLPGKIKDNPFVTGDERSIYRRGKLVADDIMRRFVLHYLPLLARRSKWTSDTRPLKVGDLVLLIEPNHTRAEWPRGRVIKMIKGKDGRHRVADIQLGNGKIKKHRSVLRLARLNIEI